MKRLLRLIAAALSTGIFVLAHAGQDLTGLYGVEGSCPKDMEKDALGAIYVRHCFSGERFGGESRLVIVQNGERICGWHAQCEGFNCSRLYSGRLVGTSSEGRLRLFAEDGHREDGVADEISYIVVPGGLTYPDAKSRAPIYVRRAAQLRSAALRAACIPQMSGKAPVLREYRMQVSGLPADNELERAFQAVAEQARRAPPTRLVRLSRLRDQTSWTDARGSNNHVIRKLVVRNDTKRGWEVVGQHPEMCTAFLRSEAGQVGERSVDAGPGISIAPGESLEFASCNGSNWHFAAVTAAGK